MGLLSSQNDVESSKKYASFRLFNRIPSFRPVYLLFLLAKRPLSGLVGDVLRAKAKILSKSWHLVIGSRPGSHRLNLPGVARRTFNEGDGLADEDDNEELGPLTPSGDVARAPGETSDPPWLVHKKIPDDIFERFEVVSYRNAAVVLSERHHQEFNEILVALREFSISSRQIRMAGGNESEIPKIISASLRPKGWHETIVQGDLIVRLTWREQTGVKRGKPIMADRSRELRRENHLDGHKIDYVKGRVAFDLEWNSKDQTFDRDLYAFNSFFLCGVIDAAILLMRSEALNDVFRRLGPALKKNGEVDLKPDGAPRMTKDKYGASTTWMGKLLYRLNAGRNGGCPVLALGIKPSCISDWTPA